MCFGKTLYFKGTGIVEFTEYTLLFLVFFASMTSSGEADWSFPNSLAGFGYAFNKDGQLRKIDPSTGLPGSECFEFNVSDDQEYNQKRYEALGDILTDHIYELLESEVGLQKVMVPQHGSLQDSAVIFVSPDTSKTNRLLILIPGSGAVKSGQWARSLIINDSLQSGTQIPFIKQAKELGYSLLVMNPNDNVRISKGKMIKIKGSQNSKEHVDYVWKQYIKEINPKHIAIIAHSYGGFLTIDLAMRYFTEFESKVFAIALTDSVHNLSIQKVPPKILEYLQKVSRNWASHNTPVDTPMPQMQGIDIPRVSAGHTKHEMTSWSSFKSVFSFIQEKYHTITEKEEL